MFVEVGFGLVSVAAGLRALGNVSASVVRPNHDLKTGLSSIEPGRIRGYTTRI